jgi:hypothetical protein
VNVHLNDNVHFVKSSPLISTSRIRSNPAFETAFDCSEIILAQTRRGCARRPGKGAAGGGRYLP